MNEMQDIIPKPLEKEKQKKEALVQKIVIQKQVNNWLQREVETLEKKLAIATAELRNGLKNVIAIAECAQYQREILSKGRFETYAQEAKVHKFEKDN